MITMPKILSVPELTSYATRDAVLCVPKAVGLKTMDVRPIQTLKRMHCVDNLVNQCVLELWMTVLVSPQSRLPAGVQAVADTILNIVFVREIFEFSSDLINQKIVRRIPEWIRH